LRQIRPSTTPIDATTQNARGIASDIARYLLGFVLLWLVFYEIFRLFPYVSAGADVVYRAKIQQEFSGIVFSNEHPGKRVLIFGSSKVLAGFVPAYFDQTLAGRSKYHSYNSGYPARSTFVPQLSEMVKRRTGVPDILLLTLPWISTAEHINLLHPALSDHDTAEAIFPFRYLIRDFFSFLLSAREHGGPLKYYREAHANVERVIGDRGYYFVSEQSHYQNDRLPDDFRLASDQPAVVLDRSADAGSAELKELNRIVETHQIKCYFVPQYMREGEYAPPPTTDTAFANLLRQNSSCKQLGPDYYLYPNRMFSDHAHLNREGALIYTRALYELLSQAESTGR
jgi:hypothetical protein